MAVTLPVPVTVVIPARDEAPRIAEVVRQHAWAAQVIVVDHGSRDETALVATAAGARVISQDGGSIADARNAGADVAAHAWVFALDADEMAEPGLAEEIRAVVTAPSFQAYRVRRRNFYLGREQTRGHWGRDRVTRLYRRELRWCGHQVHEFLETDGPVGDLAATLHHEPYRDLSHHFEKVNRYARWGALDLLRAGRRAGVPDLLFRPLWRFVKAYLLNGSFRDGRFGLVTSLLGAQTAFMKYAHLWALQRESASQEDAGSGRPPR